MKKAQHNPDSELLPRELLTPEQPAQIPELGRLYAAADGFTEELMDQLSIQMMEIG